MIAVAGKSNVPKPHATLLIDPEQGSASNAEYYLVEGRGQEFVKGRPVHISLTGDHARTNLNILQRFHITNRHRREAGLKPKWKIVGHRPPKAHSSKLSPYPRLTLEADYPRSLICDAVPANKYPLYPGQPLTHIHPVNREAVVAWAQRMNKAHGRRVITIELAPPRGRGAGRRGRARHIETDELGSEEASGEAPGDEPPQDAEGSGPLTVEESAA